MRTGQPGHILRCEQAPPVFTTQSEITGCRRIPGFVNTSYSSRLRLENSDTTAPSGPAWNQCSVSGGMVYCSPGLSTTSCKTV